jgi:hypothetical protein
MNPTNNFTSGTIIAAIKRTDCVCLAADQLFSSNAGTAEYKTGVNCKIISHDRLPLAIASGGLRELPKNDNSSETIETRHILTKCFLNARYERHFSREYFVRQTTLHLLPLVKMARKRLLGDLAQPHKNCVNICIAYYFNGKPQLEGFRVEDSVITVERDGRLECPGRLQPQFGHLASDGSFYGEHLDDNLAAAAHLRKGIEHIIQWEASHFPANRLECGGVVDVMMVDKSGARFVS